MKKRKATREWGIINDDKIDCDKDIFEHEHKQDVDADAHEEFQE